MPGLRFGLSTAPQAGVACAEVLAIHLVLFRTSLFTRISPLQTTATMSFRAGLRFFNTFRASGLRNAVSKPAQRRTYQSAAETNVDPPPNQSRMQQLWNSPVGPKTVHFWAPIMKWGLVLAGAADFARPVESLSISQNGALMATGLIWTRWCFVIKPRNLLCVAFVFCVRD